MRVSLLLLLTAGSALPQFQDLAIPDDVPLPHSLGGVQIKLGGVPMPLALVSPSEIRWQVPWNWPIGDAPFQLLSGKSPFEGSPPTITVAALSPAFYGTTGQLMAVHSQWDALVTPDRPAEPGELLHVYMYGLGPVTPAVPTGMPAPLEPPARVTLLPRCQFWDGAPNDSEVLYAGLAAGMVGIYPCALTPVALVCDYGPDSEFVSANALLPVVVPPR